MLIRVLTTEVATKIAAGEVVERPASVVKELLENSIDAGATEVSIEVQGGGVDYIRVADNGSGIAKEELPLAFQRYATSKLHDSQDLESIATMGFRGEALPSIAAVSQVSLLSRPASQTSGALIEVAEGQIVREEAQGAPQGTVVTVQHLFRYFPPRRKFLRSAASEASRVQAVVTHYAMAYPEIRFSLVADGANTFLHAGSGSLRDAIAAVYGSEVAEAMLDLSPVIEPDERQELSITGLLSPPSLSRANRSYISFSVNRRWVQSRLLGYALEQAYQGFLMEHRHPIAVVNISIPFQEVDVNVHPAKSEVRFRWENQVFSALQKDGTPDPHRPFACSGVPPGTSYTVLCCPSATRGPLMARVLAGPGAGASARGRTFNHPPASQCGSPSPEGPGPGAKHLSGRRRA